MKNEYYILWFPNPAKTTKIVARDCSKKEARQRWKELIRKATKLKKSGVLRLYNSKAHLQKARYFNCEVPKR